MAQHIEMTASKKPLNNLAIMGYDFSRPRSPKEEANPLKGCQCRFDPDRGYVAAMPPPDYLAVRPLHAVGDRCWPGARGPLPAGAASQVAC